MRVLAFFVATTAIACGGSVLGSPADDGGAGESGGNSGASGNSSGGTAGSSSGSAPGSSGSGSGSGNASGSSSGRGTGSGSSSGQGPDEAGTTGPSPWDAAVADGDIQDAAFDVVPAPTGLAGFAFIVNGVVQTPMSCTGADWEYPWVQGEAFPSDGYPPVPAISSVVIVNTGTLPMPYIAQSYWSGHAVPGGLTGAQYQLAGVLQPDQQVDITPVYMPGIVAILGSAEPFSYSEAGYVADEGTIVPWPEGVPGSGGATTMYVAQIDVPPMPMSACEAVPPQW